MQDFAKMALRTLVALLVHRQTEAPDGLCEHHREELAAHLAKRLGYASAEAMWEEVELEAVAREIAESCEESAEGLEEISQKLSSTNPLRLAVRRASGLLSAVGRELHEALGPSVVEAHRPVDTNGYPPSP